MKPVIMVPHVDKDMQIGAATRPSGALEARKPDLYSLLKDALDSSGDAVLITGEDGKVQWASKAFYAKYLPGRRSVAGEDRRALLEIQAKAFRDPRLFRETLTALLTSPFEKGEAEWELASGHQIIHLSVRPVRDEAGKLLGRIETYREEEQSTVACLADREIVDSIPAGVIVVDDTMSLVYTNRAGASFIDQRLGFALEEVKTLEALGLDHPLTKAAINVLTSGQPVRLIDYRPRAEDEAWFDLAVTPMVVHGEVGGVSIVLVNSTVRHKLIAKVEQAQKYDDFFIGLMSHDIRNFNQVTMGYLEMLELSENLSEDERSYLTKAQSGVAGSNRLIENVLKARTVLASGEQNVAPVDLAKVLRDDITYVLKAHAGQPVHINARLPEPGTMVLANQYVNEIFRHILENAIKYDPHPEKAIDLEVSESSEAGQAYRTVRITDHGRGIPEDRRQAIFERIGMTTRGSGIGLSMVNLIVKKLGGRLWVEDRVPGDSAQGSVFVVQLRRA